jgi:DNA-binding LacI/PurR family transcriptional regulator
VKTTSPRPVVRRPDPAHADAGGARGRASVIREQLRQRVLSGQWRPAQQIESEAALVEQFGVCRATITKSLKELEVEGLLVSQPGRGRFVASHVGRRKTYTLAAIVPDLGRILHPAMARPLAGISEVALESTYHLQVLGLNARQTPANGNGLWMGLVDPGTFDGAIVMAGQIPMERLIELAVQVPVVYCGGPSVADRYAGVIADFILPAYTAARRCVELGHRRIALLTLPDGHRQGYDQSGGVRLALQGTGVELEIVTVARNQPHLAAEAMTRRLEQGGPRPTAVICGSDDLAQGAILAMRQRSLRVPQDCSVFGFGDFLSDSDLDVPLTTFHMDWVDLGRRAARQMFWMLDHPGQIPATVMLGLELVERGSVAAAP